MGKDRAIETHGTTSHPNVANGDLLFTAASPGWVVDYVDWLTGGRFQKGSVNSGHLSYIHCIPLSISKPWFSWKCPILGKWFRNNIIHLMNMMILIVEMHEFHPCWWKKSGIHQLRSIVDPIIYTVPYIPGAGFLPSTVILVLRYI